MPMLVIAGTFAIVHSEPDGNSVHFTATDASDWDLLRGTPVQRNAGGVAQLRLDAIDALETHYTAPSGGGRLHQPLALAHDAAARLLALLGFTDVTRSGETVTASTPASVPGYILTRTADKYGRCVSMIGPGDPPAASGSQLHVTVEHLRATCNHGLLSEGLVYPTYYSLLYAELRNELTAATATARAAGTGVWAKDATQSGVTIESLATITDEAVILPKLFRRLAEYLEHGRPSVSLDGFRAFLDQQQDRLWIVSTGSATGFSTVVEVDGQTVRLLRPPEDLVFQEG